MTGAIYICTTDDSCPRHGRYIYYCFECQGEWEDANPRRVQAISDFASGKGSRGAVDAARKVDRERTDR